MKNPLLTLLFFLSVLTGFSQESTSSYNILKMAYSSHATTLGGQNISVVDDMPSVGWQNPALLSGVSDKSLGLSFMTYAADSKLMGAQFVKALGERHTIGFGAEYLGYGEMDETDASGIVIGRFSPKDIVAGAGYSYLLSDRWAGGANLKLAYSKIADFSAVGLAVDVGLNYYDEEKDISFSAVLKNIGTEVKSFDETRQKLPFEAQLGLTFGFEHLPARVSVTFVDVTRWKDKYYYLDAEDEELTFGRKALNHLVLGIDILPAESFYLSIGYNFRRGYELKAAGSSHAAGLTAGAGLRVKNFKLGAAYARYHYAYSSLLFDVAYSF